MDKRKSCLFYFLDAEGRRVAEVSAGGSTQVVLGRGQHGVPSSDKRCSRKQAELHLDGAGRLTLIPSGVNPSYLKKATSKEGEAVMMQRNEKYELADGDVFTLVANSYPFTVVREEKGFSTTQPPKHTKDNTEVAKKESKGAKNWKCSKCTFLNEALVPWCQMCDAKREGATTSEALAGASGSQQGSKRKNPEKDEPDSHCEPALKRRKPESEDDRPVCKYGESCYRKNPAHFKEFCHPHMDKKREDATRQREDEQETKKMSLSKITDKQHSKNRIEHTERERKKQLPESKPTEAKVSGNQLNSDSKDNMHKEPEAKIAPVSPFGTDNRKKPFGSATELGTPATVPDNPPTASPSGKKTLKMIPSASPTRVAPGARLVLEYNSDEDEEEELSLSSGTQASLTRVSPQVAKTKRPSEFFAKKTPSLQSLSAMISQEPSSGKPVTNTNTKKRTEEEVTKVDIKALAKPLVTTKGARSLAFPSFSTSQLGMPSKHAAVVITKAIKGFLRARMGQDLRLVLVLDGDNDPVGPLLEEEGWEDHRFVITRIPVTKLGSTPLASAFLATETDWRLRGGGTRYNRMLHEAAGPSLMQDAKKLYSTASECGQVYPVSLPSGSSLYADGVRVVVHCRPPNMNPSKPDCINDEKEAHKLLKETYKRLFSFFGSVIDLLVCASLSEVEGVIHVHGMRRRQLRNLPESLSAQHVSHLAEQFGITGTTCGLLHSVEMRA